MNAFLHSSLFHALLVVAASAASAGILAILDALHSGAIAIPPAYAIVGTLVTAVLTLLGVELRNWLAAQTPAP